MSGEILNSLKNSLVDLDPEKVQEDLKEALNLGVPPTEIIRQGLAEGMDIIGEKYETREYFLSELIMAGEIVKEGVEFLEPYMEKGDIPVLGTVVVGTVSGDLHDIGKNVFAILMRAAGFKVVDLGADVPSTKFVEAVKECNPDILGLSTLLTPALQEMEEIIRKLEAEGLRGNVKVIIGGAAVTKSYGEKIGADYTTKDAVEGVSTCRKWVK